MAKGALVFSLFVMFLLMTEMHASHVHGFGQNRGLLQQDVGAGTDCPQKCDARCAKAGRADRCIKYCLICCDKCNCVPSGTYGYPPGDCDCYAKMMSSKHTHKCP